MINNQVFYRRDGIRMLSQLMAPNMKNLFEIELPINSIYHYCDFDGLSNGPINDDSMFRGNTKPIQVYHITELSTMIGNPRIISYLPNDDIKTYHMQNKRTKWVRNLDTFVRDDKTLIVFNYSLIHNHYKYVKSIFSDYFRTYNLLSTIIDNSLKLNTTYNRNHFFTLNIPKIIPSLYQLNLASEKDISTTLVNIFKDKDALVLLELWKWLYKDKEVSDKSIFSKIPLEQLKLYNFVYIESGKYTVLNLAYLYSFFNKSSIEYLNKNTELSKEQKDDLLRIFSMSKIKLDPIQLQKRLLKFAMSVMEVRASMISKDETDKEILNKPLVEEGTINTVVQTIDDENVSKEDIEKIIKEQDQILDQELANLNQIVKNSENTTTVKDILNSTPPKLEEGITNLCDRLADDGLLSAAEYRRFNKLSTKYKDIKIRENQPIDEFIKISKEDLVVSNEFNISDKKSVLDKNMLRSRLIDFDSKYIKNILAKDVYSMVLSSQNNGVIVEDYQIETTKDVMGEYDTHIVKLTPVIGKSSTIRFKLPRIKEDGQFISNGVKYRFRKQRGDLPIRKISSNEVALTSYYGKTFVNRGRRKVYDYNTWLINQVIALGFDKDNNTIKNMFNANVFNKDVILPRAYSAIAHKVASFECRGFTLNFDYSKRESLYGLDNIKRLETKNLIIFGKNDKNMFLLMDEHNTVYVVKDNSLEVFGSIEHFLNLSNNGPIEYAEVKVYGKDIPVGLVLSYFLGLENLLNSLKIKYKRLQSTRVNLNPHEWCIKFSDEILVFSKEDRLASLILGGFGAYQKIIGEYSIYNFDKKGVYLNILEAMGLSVRYLREMELMNKMFIDPITRDILIDMKEPLTFQGLLIRSCELLLSDYHPDALDPKYMRIKGYERIAGSIYTELVNSFRIHEGKLSKANSAIEMSPYAVWSRITEDPSKALVNELNPIESLKEIEAVTFAGTGGRNKRSMVKRTRIYHRNDMGTISESTVDSSDVGINIFTSADPMLNNLRGTSDKYSNKSGVVSLVSTSALIAPAANNDDQYGLLVK